VKNLKELIALAKARPGSINYGSSGEGTLIHLATELITHMAQVKMVHIPYKGGGPALIDLIAGQIQLVLSPPQTGMAYARAGRLRALGMTTAERAQSDPDVPTIAESGVRGYEATNWHALIGPKGLPRPVVERLNGEIRRIIATPEVKSVFLANGIEPDGSTPDQLAALIRKDYEQWRVVVKATNLKVDS
jgi:tripartite-type tricarboxylate transporter receptor subunit TctC